MGKIRRGGYVFISWKSDHPPRHVHVYRAGELIVASQEILALIMTLQAEGRL